MTFLSEGGLPCWVTGLAVRYDEFPLAVFSYHIMCYTVNTMEVFLDSFSWAFSAFLFCRISCASFSSGK